MCECIIFVQAVSIFLLSTSIFLQDQRTSHSCYRDNFSSERTLQKCHMESWNWQTGNENHPQSSIIHCLI